ncbi:MAG: acyltransferase family protein [Marinilabiliaceae bacterium]|nr:acyltransferase family protein [Marinilabiliaceae bacterium]
MLNRIQYIDVLRGFAIILVVLGHALEKNGYSDSFLYNMIYSFHMPLFFCISGFVTMYSWKLDKGSHITDYFRYIWRKFIAIMIPFFVWSLIVSPFFLSSSFERSYDALLSSMNAIANNTIYWFLPCLFMLISINMIWNYIVNVIRKPKTEILILLLLMACVVAVSRVTDYVHSVLSFFIPFYIGIFCARYAKLYEMLVNDKIIYTISIILFCLLVGYFGLFGGYFGNGVINRLIRLMTGILSLPILFNLFANYKFNRVVTEWMSILGRYTLVIYVSHMTFIKNIPILQDIGIFAQIIIFGTISILICFFCVLIAKFFERSNILSICFLGKKHRDLLNK